MGQQRNTLKYKKYWNERALKEKIANEKLRQEAITISEGLKNILAKEFSVKRVILFGSVLKKGCFKDCSDIDIAVEGLSKDVYFKALGRLMIESPFNIDLKPVEDANGLFRKRIDRGKVLYEKREHS